MSSLVISTIGIVIYSNFDIDLNNSKSITFTSLIVKWMSSCCSKSTDSLFHRCQSLCKLFLLPVYCCHQAGNLCMKLGNTLLHFILFISVTVEMYLLFKRTYTFDLVQLSFFLIWVFLKVLSAVS